MVMLCTSFRTCLASRSNSRFTAAPGSFRPSVVWSRVCGISITLNRSVSTSTTVRLTPSTATDPFGTSNSPNSGGNANQNVSQSPLGLLLEDVAGRVDVPGDEVPAERVARAERPLQVHAVARGELPEVGLRERLGAGLERERVAVAAHHSQAARR